MILIREGNLKYLTNYICVFLGYKGEILILIGEQNQKYSRNCIYVLSFSKEQNLSTDS